MMECLVYQCSVVADPWAEVFVITKYDLIRHTSKAILHALFRDYKARLSDERLIRRLKQQHRWNCYKRSLLDEIRNRKRRADGPQVTRTEGASKRNNQASLSAKDFDRVGEGEMLWDERAQTPPRTPYHKQYGMATDVFKVTCARERDEHGGIDVKVERDTREATMVALDQKILRTIATQRYRKQFQQNGGTATKRLSIDALTQANVKKEDLKESQVISARRFSTEEEKGSKERQLSPLKTLRNPKSPRGKKGAAAQQANEQRTDNLEKKLMAYEKQMGLEERAKQAAEEHLQKRANRVEEIRSELKERNQSANQTAHRKSSKESLNVEPAEQSNLTREQKAMLKSKARSFIRVSLHGRHVKSAEAAVGKIQSGRDLEPILPAVGSKESGRGSKRGSMIQGDL